MMTCHERLVVEHVSVRPDRYHTYVYIGGRVALEKQ